MFNNFQVLLIYYLLFGLTDFERDVEVRKDIEIWLALLVTFYIVFNLTRITKTVIVKTKEACKKKKHRPKVKCLGKAKEEKKFSQTKLGQKQSVSQEIEDESDVKSLETQL